MVGSLRRVFTACFVFFLLTASAAAFGGRSAARPAVGVVYAPAPICCYYVIATPPCWGAAPLPPAAPRLAPPPRVMPLAKPAPAPPSTTNEPPLNGKRPPTITESRSSGGVSQVQAIDLPPGRCRVGFWNITGGEVTLTIDGQPHTLAKDRAVTVNLPRNFAWQVSGRESRSERVPEGQNIFEVILRP